MAHVVATQRLRNRVHNRPAHSRSAPAETPTAGINASRTQFPVRSATIRPTITPGIARVQTAFGPLKCNTKRIMATAASTVVILPAYLSFEAHPGTRMIGASVVPSSPQLTRSAGQRQSPTPRPSQYPAQPLGRYQEQSRPPLSSVVSTRRLTTRPR